MSDANIECLTRKLVRFRNERNWKQFHNLKDLIISLNLEAGELLELTQWQSTEAFQTAIQSGDLRQNLKDECADVLLYLLLIAEKADIDLLQCASEKIEKNATKYPVEKAKGNAKKYTQL